MDIADLFGDNRDRISQKKGNDNMKYILVIINSLTKYAYAYPLPNRENTSIIVTYCCVYWFMPENPPALQYYWLASISIHMILGKPNFIICLKSEPILVNRI